MVRVNGVLARFLIKYSDSAEITFPGGLPFAQRSTWEWEMGHVALDGVT